MPVVEDGGSTGERDPRPGDTGLPHLLVTVSEHSQDFGTFGVVVEVHAEGDETGDA